MATLKQFARMAGVDPEAERELLTVCLNAAQNWFEHAGCLPISEEDPFLDYWIMNLACWMYDNRGAGGEGAFVPPYIVSSVHQLRARKGAGA